MIKLVDLQRNDLAGSMAYYAQCQAAGKWTPDKAQSVATLHDDPDKFFAAIAALRRVPGIAVDNGNNPI